MHVFVFNIILFIRFRTLIDCGVVKDYVTPKFVKNFFRQSEQRASHPSVDFEAISDDNTILQQKKNASFLLSYCLSDVAVSLSMEYNQSEALDLHEIYLIPTEVRMTYYAYLQCYRKLPGWFQTCMLSRTDGSTTVSSI